MKSPDTADFGFERVAVSDKAERVRRVFEAVAGRYDLMNDLMSLGMHRAWKRFAVQVSGARAGSRVLDLAAGTGDCAALYRDRVGAAVHARERARPRHLPDDDEGRRRERRARVRGNGLREGGRAPAGSRARRRFAHVSSRDRRPPFPGVVARLGAPQPSRLESSLPPAPAGRRP